MENIDYEYRLINRDTSSPDPLVQYGITSLFDFKSLLYACDNILNSKEKHQHISKAMAFMEFFSDLKDYRKTFASLDVDAAGLKYIMSSIMLCLGAEYYGGVWVDQNYHKAQLYYEKSFALGNPQAACNLGYIHLYGRTGTKDVYKAFACFKYAANYDNVNGLYKLGDMYDMGLGCEKNHDKAFELYKRANKLIDKNDYSYPDIQKRLGDAYFYGRAINTDYYKAYEHYRNAELSAYKRMNEGVLFMDTLIAKLEGQIAKCKQNFVKP